MEKKKNTNLFFTLIFIAVIYVAVAVLEQFISPNSILFTVLKKGAIYSLVAVSMNLLNGFTGLFSLGQAGFMLLGAYTYAIFTMPLSVKLSTEVFVYFKCAVHFETGILIGILAAGLVAAFFAALIGLPVLKLKSDYLAIATLGFAEILRALCQWKGLGPITNAANPIRSYLDLTDVAITPTLFVFLVAGVCIALIVLLINSSYGRAFKAIRDDEVAAEAMGINLFKHKEMSFVISSFFAGISGALLAMYQYTVQASAFKSAMTYEILLIVVIGGIGSISGSCIASFLYIAASEWWLRFLDDSATFQTANQKLLAGVGLSLAAVALGALFFYRAIRKSRKSGQKFRLTPSLVLTAAVVVLVVAWEMYFTFAVPTMSVPLLRSGFRKLVFSIIIMIIVLFFSRGLMGDHELSFDWLTGRSGKKNSAQEVKRNG